MVEPHLLVAVRFPPTREGSGTKGSGRRPKNRAFFQVSPQYLVRSWVLLYFFGMFWDFMAVFIVSTLGAVCPCPQTTGCGRNSPVLSPGAFLGVFHRLNQ